MTIAIQTRGLGKRYVIQHQSRKGTTFVDSASAWLGSPLRRLRELRGTARHQERFWALRDIDLTVEEGEVLGVIGRNGAGKSTLLKILSRITKPTTGEALVRGRVGSLLEVGTGFHPELTGRENIFLNGAILGMRRDEIRRRFDEIIDFAGVERFLDTPVKRYSSGMQIRLAFAVAAHLEPEILLVDEVLAVGDAAFQKKCLGKISGVAKSGRTVLYVSHNLPTVLSLTSRCVCIEGGEVRFDGSPEAAVADYLKMMEASRSEVLESRSDRSGSGRMRLTGVEFRNRQGESISSALAGKEVQIAIDYRADGGKELRSVDVAMSFFSSTEEKLFTTTTAVSSGFDRLPAEGTIVCSIPKLPLQPGSYPFEVFCLVEGDMADRIEHAGELDVAGGDFFGTGRLPNAVRGPLLVGHTWGASSKKRPGESE